MAQTEKTEDLRIRRTRFLLHKAFMELLAEKDFQSITVQDIADRAMVHRATFYDHFLDKYALLEYSVRELFKETLHKVVSEDFNFSAGNLHLLIQTACEFLSGLRHHCAPNDQQFLLLVQTQITTSITEILAGWLQKGKSPERKAALTATMASWAIYGAALYWSQENGRESLKGFVARVLPTILASLGLSDERVKVKS